MDAINIRRAHDNDKDHLIKLIGGCFCEYEGCVLDLDGIDHAMLAIESYVKKYDGEFWLAEGEGGKVIGSAGYIVEDGKMELIK